VGVSRLHQVGDHHVVSPLPRHDTGTALLKHVGENLAASPASVAALVRSGGQTSYPIKEQYVEPDPANGTPVSEARKASLTEEVIAHSTPGDDREGLALVSFGKEPLPVILHYRDPEPRNDLGSHRGRYDVGKTNYACTKLMLEKMLRISSFFSINYTLRKVDNTLKFLP
jgi:hypothetical protein